MLEELKQQVWRANVELHTRGLIILTWGNVSGLDREKGLFVIKPSGVPYSELKPEDMVAVDLEGKVVEKGLNPSSDTPTHLALYQAFGTIGGIAHTHSPHATAFAQACIPIPCLGTTHADQFHGEIPVTRQLTRKEVETGYEANIGKVIGERFSTLKPEEIPGVLVATHGPFTWGRDAHDAVTNSVALEAVAGMALSTLRLRPDVAALPRPILEKHFYRKHGPTASYGQPRK